MSTDMYDNYYDKTFEYHYKPTFELYNSQVKIPDYIWDYEDTITFNFSLRECGCNPDTDTLETKKAILEFYNWRGEVVASKSYNLNEINCETLTISYNIDSKQSKNVFVRGLYTLRIQIADQAETEEELLNQEVTTVLPINKLLLKVK